MEILSNSLRIEFDRNPEQIVQLLVNGWLVREGLDGFCQALTDEQQLTLRFKDMRTSAQGLMAALKTLNGLLACIRHATSARLCGELLFGNTEEVFRVTAAEWAHGRFVIEWDHALPWDDFDGDEGDGTHET